MARRIDKLETQKDSGLQNKILHSERVGELAYVELNLPNLAELIGKSFGFKNIWQDTIFRATHILGKSSRNMVISADDSGNYDNSKHHPFEFVRKICPHGEILNVGFIDRKIVDNAHLLDRDIFGWHYFHDDGEPGRDGRQYDPGWDAIDLVLKISFNDYVKIGRPLAVKERTYIEYCTEKSKYPEIRQPLDTELSWEEKYILSDEGEKQKILDLKRKIIRGEIKDESELGTEILDRADRPGLSSERYLLDLFRLREEWVRVRKEYIGKRVILADDRTDSDSRKIFLQHKIKPGERYDITELVRFGDGIGNYSSNLALFVRKINSPLPVWYLSGKREVYNKTGGEKRQKAIQEMYNQASKSHGRKDCNIYYDYQRTVRILADGKEIDVYKYFFDLCQ